MNDLYLWFPEDFDERYKKYREEHTEKNVPEPFFSERLENERKFLLSIKSEEDFQHEIDYHIPTSPVQMSMFNTNLNLTQNDKFRA